MKKIFAVLLAVLIGITAINLTARRIPRITVPKVKVREYKIPRFIPPVVSGLSKIKTTSNQDIKPATRPVTMHIRPNAISASKEMVRMLEEGRAQSKELWETFQKDNLYQRMLVNALQGGYDDYPDSLLALACEAERRNHLAIADSLAKRAAGLPYIDCNALAMHEPKQPKLKEEWRKMSHDFIQSMVHYRILSPAIDEDIPDTLDSYRPYVNSMILVEKYVPELRPLTQIAWSRNIDTTLNLFIEAADLMFRHGNEFEPEFKNSVLAQLYYLYLKDKRYDKAEQFVAMAAEHVDSSDTHAAEDFDDKIFSTRVGFGVEAGKNPFYYDYLEWETEHHYNPALVASYNIIGLDGKLFGIDNHMRTITERPESWELPDLDTFTDEQKTIHDRQRALARKGLETAARKGDSPETGLSDTLSVFKLEELYYLLQARDRSQIDAAIVGLQDLGKRLETAQGYWVGGLRCRNAIDQALLVYNRDGNSQNALEILRKNRKLLKLKGVYDSDKELYNNCIRRLEEMR